MPSDTICKTVHQYNKGQAAAQDMKKLLDIAKDYSRVKNYVYARYGGIASLPKIYPGYTVQNEMTASGLRTQLAMPSVYFYLAIFDALGDIKSQWTRTKSKVQKLVSQNENLSPQEKHYLRFVLKASNAFIAVLNQQQAVMPKEIQKRHEELAAQVDVSKMHRYLCRQVRKYHVKLHTEQALGFSLSERAYRYADHGIYISTKENRKRVFVPLTDNCQHKNQIYIKLHPDEGLIEIKAAVHAAVHAHADYTNHIGTAAGIFTMLTTDKGHCYGAELGKYQVEYAEWVRMQTVSYNRNRLDNPGRKKYHAQKKRLEERLHSYINQELNRFFREERPQAVYIVKLPKPQAGGVNRKINHSVSMWQRGYIRKRLAVKCREQSVEIVEVLGKDIGRECSCCGAAGDKKDGIFYCASCGYKEEEKTNTARNVLKRGMAGKVVR